MSNIKIKSTKGNVEDFIGWVSPDKNLVVTGIAGKQNTTTLYYVTCKICSKDSELFPTGYFISNKSNLLRGSKPCGCAYNPKWEGWQFLVLARRVGEKKGFIVHGFAEDFKGHETRLICECRVDRHKWNPTIGNIVNRQSGCPVCKSKTIGNLVRNSQALVIENCNTVCDKMGYMSSHFPNGYESIHSTVNYLCKIHGLQSTSYKNFLNHKNKCSPCSKIIRYSSQEAKEVCETICAEMDYEFLGFIGEYKNQRSRFKYKCPKHGIKEVRYENFVRAGNRCKDCWKESGNGNGYYPERKDEKDYLYILDFNGRFIKVGRSFDVDERIRNLKSLSKIKKIYKIHVLTATHKEIYDYEQTLLENLRGLGFHHSCNWSTECFENEALIVLNDLIDLCNFECYYSV